MVVTLVLGRPPLGHRVTEGMWMLKKKDAEQEDLGWLDTEQLWEAKQSSHKGQELRLRGPRSQGQNLALPTFCGCDLGRLLNLSLSFLT